MRHVGKRGELGDCSSQELARLDLLPMGDQEKLESEGEPKDEVVGEEPLSEGLGGTWVVVQLAQQVLLLKMDGADGKLKASLMTSIADGLLLGAFSNVRVVLRFSSKDTALRRRRGSIDCLLKVSEAVICALPKSRPSAEC